MVAPSIRPEVKGNDQDDSTRFFAAAALVALASVAIGSASGAANGSKRFEAQFQESNVLLTNRIADLGIFQLINTGTGTVEGFGPATMVLAMSQDRSVTPCGPGSWTNAGSGGSSSPRAY